MKPSQKLIVCFENYTVITRFDDLDVILLPLAKKLELNGDKFGPVVTLDSVMCITMRYADKTRDGIPEAKIFGYTVDEFLLKQYK
jgi:hypothetical protein